MVKKNDFSKYILKGIVLFASFIVLTAIFGSISPFAFAIGTLPNCHTITITISRDKQERSRQLAGDGYHGNATCKPCSHLLNDLRSKEDKLRVASNVEANAQKSLSELKSKNTSGYKLQQKYRLSEKIKHAQGELKRLRSRRGKAGRALNRSQIKLATCRKKHCKPTGVSGQPEGGTGLSKGGSRKFVYGPQISHGAFRTRGDEALTEDEPRQPKEKNTANGHEQVNPKKKQIVTGRPVAGQDQPQYKEQPLGKLVLPGEPMGKYDVPPGTLKTAKGSPLDDIKPSYSYVEQEPGTCNSAIGGIADSFFLPMPDSEKAVNKAASAIGNFAKGAVSGLFNVGGVSPFGNTGGNDGARIVNKPQVPWYEFTNGDTTVEIGGRVYKPRSKKKKPEIRIAQRIKDSPDKGGPHMMVLQNRDGQLLRPSGYMIFEVWRHWKLTITITRDTWVNGAHTSHSVSRESTQWNELAERYRKIMEAPGIWEQFGVAPFGKLRGIIAQFPLPEHFNPADWTLVKHDTSKATVNGKEVIRTVPFVASIGQGKKNRLTFKAAPGGKTAYQREHGCQSPNEAMNAALGMFVPDYLKGKAQKAPSQYKLKKTKMDAARGARILILQPRPTDKWLAAYHKLSQKMQVDGAAAMADIIFRAATGLESWDPKRWQKEFSRLGAPLRNMAIMAANQWKQGMNEKQREEVSRSYSKLPPNLQRVFKREFIKTLAFNLFFDLRQPTPVAY